MKRLIALTLAVSLTIAPVAAQQRNYNMVDPSSVTAPPAAPIPVQTANTRGTDPNDQRYMLRAEKPSGKPHKEFWYILGAGLLMVVGGMLLGPNPNKNNPNCPNPGC